MSKILLYSYRIIFTLVNGLVGYGLILDFIAFSGAHRVGFGGALVQPDPWRASMTLVAGIILFISIFFLTFGWKYSHKNWVRVALGIVFIPGAVIFIDSMFR